MNSKNLFKKTTKKPKIIADVLPWLCLGATVWAQPTYAEGSRTLYPATATGSRANLEWRSSTAATPALPWGGLIERRTLLKVYAQAGEVIMLGSSGVNAVVNAALPANQGDILVYSPGQITGLIGSETVPPPAAAAFRCTDQPGTGRIASRAQELAGPNTIPPTIPGAFTPCFYVAPATGIYDVVFVGPSGFGNNAANTNVLGNIAQSPENFDTTQGPTVSSWDVTVRSSLTSNTDINGRLFSYGLSLFTGGNARPVNSSIYLVTRDGFRYQTDLRGMDPNGFLVYGNLEGYLNSDGLTPLYHNLLAANTGNTNNNATLSAIQGGVSLARPQFPIFLSDLKIPQVAAEAENILFQLSIPTIPVIPTVTAPIFLGNAVNNTSFVGNGGTFSFNSNTPGTYEIIIQGSGSTNFDPSNPLNRLLRGVMTAAGPQSVSWDGRANNGNFFPVGLNYPARLSIRAGEYHFPLLDIENNTQGGPIITMINPPATHPLGNSQAFFDDQGYTTLNGTNVGTPGTILCGNNPPPGDPAFPGRSDPINGYNTATQASFRAFGAGTGGNTNTPCTGSFGDVKGLDLWTYFPSQAQTVTFNIVNTQADMSLTKTGPSTAIPGTAITYTVTVTNGSPIDLPNIVVNDDIPTQVLNPTWTCTVPAGSGSCPTPNGTGDINTTVTLNSGATATFTISGTLDASATGNITNTASTQPPTGFTDPNGANNTISFTSNLTPTADLAIAKTDNLTTVSPGGGISYVITVTNNGPSTVNSLTVADSLPAGFTASSYTPNTGTFDSATGNWTGLTLASGQSITLTIAGTVSATATGTLTNTATVSPPAGVTDSNPNNNTATDTTDINATADLAIAKTDNLTTVSPGGGISYVITVTNNGPSTVNSLTVADSLPAGFTASSYTPNTGTYDSTTGNWTGLTLASGQSITLTIAGTVSSTATGTLTNTATVSPPAGVTDSNPNNNTATDTTDIVQQIADLSLQKTLDTPNPTVGQNITYTLTLNNTGPGSATNVAVTDQLPAGLTFVSSNPSQGSYNATNGLWTVGNVAVNGTATLQITATLNTTNSITNTAQVSASDQPDPDSTPNNNTTGEDDQASVTFPQQPADLSLAKTLDTPNPTVGQNITYTLTLNNTGPGSATNVAVTDQLPAGLTFVSSNPSQGSYNATNGLWTVGNVAVNGTATLQITATLNTSNSITNTAQVSASDQPDPDSTPNNNTAGEDDQASVTFPQQPADLSLQKTLDTPNPTLGGNLTYTLTLRNTGPGAATNVAVTDQLPAGLTFVSSNPSQGSYNATNGLWTVGNVAVNGTATLQITATLNTSNSITNTAQVSASDQPDPDSTPGNNNSAEDDQASVVLPPLEADLRLSKTVNNNTPALGENINFTLTVTNDGPATATNVQITDTLPPGLTFVSASNGGTYNSVTREIVWNLASIVNGGNVPLTVQATVNNAITQSNRAEITASDQPDPDSTPENGNLNEDDFASVTLTSQSTADLGIVKTVDNPNPTPGQQINYTLTLTNNGPGDATNVQVTEPLAPGLTFVSATTSQGTYDSGTGLWNAGNIANGSSLTLTIRATVTTANPVTNTAQVTASDQTDPNSANNSSSVTIPEIPADLAITKTVDQPNATPGQTLSYTITLTNNGPGNASDVAVTDQLPQGLTLLSSNASQGTYDATTGLWTVGNVPNTGTATLTISARVNTATPITNTAQVTASDQPDPVAGNNSASVTTPQQAADLVLAKSVDNPNPTPGQQFTYTIVVTNTGPANATGVQITDQIPAGVSFISAIPSSGTYDNTTGLWNLGNLNNGQAATLRITAVLNAANATNTASITASNQPDPNTTNNQDSVTVPATGADLSLRKTANVANPRLGDTIVYTLTLTNSGPQNATGVQVTDRLPAGLTFISASGTYDSATGIWTVGNVASGGTATLTIQARKTAEGPVTNTAQVSASDQPDPDSTVGNNNPSEDDQASVTLPQDIADLSLSKTSDNLNPTPGTTFTYTVTLRNSGPATATGVQVLEQVPAGLTLVSSTPSTGTYDGTTGLWNVGSVTNGGSATLRLTVTLNTSDMVTNTAQVQASDQADPDSTPGNNNPGEDDQASLSLPNKPRVRLVKRVTALNGTAFNEVVDDPADTNDNAINWPPNFLQGRIDGTFIQPGDEVEYTIYFLSDGGAQAANVNLCDLIPAGLQFIGDAFGSNRGVSVLLNNTQNISTNVVDGDVGQFFAAGSTISVPAGSQPCVGVNSNGAVVVNLGNLSTATGSNPTGSYGFFRFRARFLQ